MTLPVATAVCQDRIDPAGFALEQFDTTGRWRDKDLGGRPVDATAQLKDGAELEGIAGCERPVSPEL